MALTVHEVQLEKRSLSKLCICVNVFFEHFHNVLAEARSIRIKVLILNVLKKHFAGTAHPNQHRPCKPSAHIPRSNNPAVAQNQVTGSETFSTARLLL